MSRPIAYNASGPLSGSIRGGNVNYTVDSGNRDYTTFASKKWVPSADGAAPIVFVTDTYTQGFEGNPSLAVPLFYSCNGTGSAAIIYTANRVPGSPGNYSDANVALNDLINARGYFILESNDPYQGVDADGLAFDVDASKMSSYPQTGTNWRDLSGQGNTAALTNGPIWNSGGWFNFDGTDDYAVNSSSTLNITGNVTINAWIRNNGTGTSVGNYMSKAQNNGYRMRRNGGSGSPLWLYSNGNTVNGGAINDNIWYMVTGVFSSTGLRAYINSNLVASNSSPYNPASLTLDSLYIGAYTFSDEYFGGDIQNAQVYSSALTEAQVKQNYFGAPIVTDGLVFAVDANNIVSYPKSGTSAYNLTGSGTTGTLTNGPTFQLPQGGYWAFDGTDDYINFGNIINLGTSDFTLSVWVYIPSGTASTFRAILNKKGASGADAGYGIYYNTGMQKFLWSTANGSSASEVFTSNTFASIENTWANVVMVRQSGATNNGHYYVNGVYQSIAGAATILNVDSSVNLSLAVAGSTYTPYCFQGNIANSKIYNRALSAAEVLQNYQAEQYRFETPSGIITTGLVLNLEADNLDSYPGTGTTWYDISGNGNNVVWLQNPVGGTNGNSQINWNQVPGGGMFNWNPTNSDTDYFFRTDTTTGLPTGNPNYSIEIVANMLNNSNNWHLFAYGQQNPNQSNGIYYNAGADGLYKYYFGNDYVMVPNFSSNVGFGNNFHYVETYNPSSSNLRCYLNNNLIVNVTVSPTPNITLYSSGRLDIGGGVITDDRPAWAGKMGICRLYNRTLSSTEVTQNYNAIKSQYGV